jgi:hypothetical protein
MDSFVSPKDEIWFLRLCHHISNAVYHCHCKSQKDGAPACVPPRSIDSSGPQAYSVQPPLYCAHSAHLLEAPLLKRQSRFPRTDGVCTELKLQAHSVKLRRSVSNGQSHPTKSCAYSEQTVVFVILIFSHFLFVLDRLHWLFRNPMVASLGFPARWYYPKRCWKFQSKVYSLARRLRLAAPYFQNILRCLVLSALNTEV